MAETGGSGRAMWWFDGGAYVRMLRLTAREQDPHRRRNLRVTLTALPVVSAFHAVCFALDPLLFPSLRRTQVRAPVFVVGHARSGTTLLHHLLSADVERFSWFRAYELALPSLLQKKAVRSVAWLDARALGGRLERGVRRWEDERLERVRRVHPIGLTEPEEDNFVLTFSATGGFWTLLFPQMDQVGAYDVDDRPDRTRRRMARFYAACVRRQLALQDGPHVHLSKNPSFSGWVETLIEQFPDARFVVALRDPEETIPSLCKLMAGAWRARGLDADEIDRSLRFLADRSFHSYLHPFEVLDAHPDTTYAVVHYDQLVAQPRRTIERLYDELGLPVSDRLRATLEDEQRRAREHRSGHRYSLAEFGLEADAIRTRLAPLYGRFGWDSEDMPTDATVEP